MKVVSIDSFMHKWIDITADKGPEFSAEARRKFNEKIGDEGAVCFNAKVEAVEWEEDSVAFIKFIHPYQRGDVSGFRYDLYDIDDRASELLDSIGRKLKTGDVVRLSGEYASCDFGLWFSDPAYQMLPEKDGYYMISMDIQDIQILGENSGSKVVDSTKKSTKDTSLAGKAEKKSGIGKVIAGVAIVGLLYSCVSGNGDSSKESTQPQTEQATVYQETTIAQGSTVEQPIEIRNNPYEEYKTYPIYSEQFAHYYLHSGKLDINNIYDEMEEMYADLANASVGQVYVSPKGIFTETGFENEGFETDYIYEGELKDGQPHGVGTVYYSTYTRLTDLYFKVYTGYFDEGEFTKFGISYDLAYLDCSQGGVTSLIADQYNSEFQHYLGLYYNPINYVGNYSNGKRSGSGIELIYPKDEYKDYIMEKYSIDDVQILSGTYKNNEITEGKMYVHEYLLYEGEFKNSLKHGAGRLYYRNTNTLAFEGKFKEDEVVEGKLFDANGNIICEGTWTDGCCGIVDFYEEYYKNSNIAAKDVAEVMGEDFGSAEDWQRLKDLVDAETVAGGSSEYNSTDYSGEYIIPDSSERYLTYDDLKGLDKETLRLARNEIYAKHGRKYETEDLNAYFSSKSWYHGYLSQEEFDDSVLNQYEKANMELIKSVEQGESPEQSNSMVVDGLYQDGEVQIEIYNYYEPYIESDSSVAVLADLAIAWPNGTTEWATISEEGKSSLTITDMYGEIIGEMRVNNDQEFSIVLYGEDYTFSCIAIY